MLDAYPSSLAATHLHMYKSWILNNPDLALGKIQKFCEMAAECGMRLRMVESDHYVDIIAAYNDRELFGDYA